MDSAGFGGEAFADLQGFEGFEVTLPGAGGSLTDSPDRDAVRPPRVREACQASDEHVAAVGSVDRARGDDAVGARGPVGGAGVADERGGEVIEGGG